MTSSLRRSTVRGTAVVAVTAAVALVGAGPAFAHVTAQPGQAAQGGYTVITFRVPDESDTAGTVKLEVALPTDHPITSVRTTPIPGWTAAVTKTTLNPPVQVNGNAVTEATTVIQIDGCLNARVAGIEAAGNPIQTFRREQRKPFIIATVVQHSRLVKQKALHVVARA